MGTVLFTSLILILNCWYLTSNMYRYFGRFGLLPLWTVSENNIKFATSARNAVCNFNMKECYMHSNECLITCGICILFHDQIVPMQKKIIGIDFFPWKHLFLNKRTSHPHLTPNCAFFSLMTFYYLVLNSTALFSHFEKAFC